MAPEFELDHSIPEAIEALIRRDGESLTPTADRPEQRPLYLVGRTIYLAFPQCEYNAGSGSLGRLYWAFEIYDIEQYMRSAVLRNALAPLMRRVSVPLRRKHNLPDPDELDA